MLSAMPADSHNRGCDVSTVLENCLGQIPSNRSTGLVFCGDDEEGDVLLSVFVKCFCESGELNEFTDFRC
jgi:hypothetical protein